MIVRQILMPKFYFGQQLSCPPWPILNTSRKNDGNKEIKAVSKLAAMAVATGIDQAGLILHGGEEGDCLCAPLSLPWCP